MKKIKLWWYRLKIVQRYYEIKNRKRNVRKQIWNYLWEMQAMGGTYTCRSLNGNPNVYSWITTGGISNFKTQEEVIMMKDNEFYYWLNKVGGQNIYPNCYNPVNKAIEVFQSTHFRILGGKIGDYIYKQI